MLALEWVFLCLTVRGEARDVLLSRLLLVGALQDLSRIVTCLDSLEPLKHLLVVFCDLVEASKSLPMVQSGHDLVSLIEVGDFRW